MNNCVIYRRYSTAGDDLEPIIIKGVNTIQKALEILSCHDAYDNNLSADMFNEYVLFDTEGEIGVDTRAYGVKLRMTTLERYNAVKEEFPSSFKANDQKLTLYATYEEFYRILNDLKWFIVNSGELFSADDDFPGWSFSLDPVKIKEGDTLLVLLQNKEDFHFCYEVDPFLFGEMVHGRFIDPKPASDEGQCGTFYHIEELATI